MFLKYNFGTLIEHHWDSSVGLPAGATSLEKCLSSSQGGGAIAPPSLPLYPPLFYIMPMKNSSIHDFSSTIVDSPKRPNMGAPKPTLGRPETNTWGPPDAKFGTMPTNN